MTETMARAYNLAGGAKTFTSSDLSPYAFYYLNFIWSNSTAISAGGNAIIQTRQRDSSLEDWEVINQFQLTEGSSNENLINLTKKYLDVKFYPEDDPCGGIFSVILTAKHNSSQELEQRCKQYTLLNG
jgi:hypothetical protein